ncbi:MAG: SAM-dependent methyltransferase [Chloroflexi bacterium]|nr:SAM-dependent methyltransferase [Chloroflexota bacterium]
MIPDDPSRQRSASHDEADRPAESAYGTGRAALAEGHIRGLLRASGRLTFAAFMQAALYGADGYYTRRVRLGGESADFFTSPELHPAFGALLGRLAGAVWVALGRPAAFTLEEHGPGSGVLARDLLTWAHHERPDLAAALRYRLVEASPSLRTTQRETLRTSGLPLDGVTWENDASGAAADASASVVGLILANELVDALPVHLVVMRGGCLRERYATLDAGDGFAWVEDVPSTPALAAYFERLGIWPGEGCLAEVNLAGVAWAERTAARVERGALLLLDYGYPASELYAPSRRHGTLLTYRQHGLGSDPLIHVGDQDITAHVDFTSLARAGERGGLGTVGLISQADLLRRLGLPGYVRALKAGPLSAADHDANRRALQALVEPDGLGRVQALLQTRGLPTFDPFGEAALPDGSRGWTPLLRPGQMRLLGPLEAEGFLDLEAQWAELFGDADAEG